jgi:AAA15 family ATPase/GTPase
MSHLTYFKIQNFKCFDEIEVKEFGQYNLIVGDNNVGKTALMEAMVVEWDGWRTIGNYYHLLGQRGILERKEGIKPFFHLLVKEGKNELAINFRLSDEFELPMALGGEEVEYWFDFEGDAHENIKFTEQFAAEIVKPQIIHISQIPQLALYYNEQIAFIGVSAITGKELGEKFTKAWKNDLEILEKLVKGMTSIIPNIKDVRIGDNELLCVSIAGDKKLKPLGSMGFGSNRFVEILIALFRFQGQRLFIDEIDTGIHYSRLRDFLRTILTLADELNVQLFMTTHSKECEEAFMYVLEDKDKQKEKFRAISLFRSAKTGIIMNRVRDFDGFSHSLRSGHDIRM